MSKIINSSIIPLKLSSFQLNESVNRKDGKFIVPALLQRANEKNENTRIYPKSTLEREISKYIEGPIAEKRAYGELDHSDQSVVNLKNVCINIMEVWWEGDEVHGVLEILNTPSGKIVQELLRQDLSVGISSRGLGSVSQIDEETVEVDDDFTLICWDIVSNPSTHGAYLNQRQINESVEIENKDKVDEILTDILCQNLGFCECLLK